MKVSYNSNKLLIQFILLSSFLSCKKEVANEIKPLEISIIEVLQQDVRLESEYTGQTFGNQIFKLTLVLMV